MYRNNTCSDRNVDPIADILDMYALIIITLVLVGLESNY